MQQSKKQNFARAIIFSSLIMHFTIMNWGGRVLLNRINYGNGIFEIKRRRIVIQCAEKCR
jgi:hypothetical protein